MDHRAGSPTGDRTPPEGPPSAQARSALSADLRRELADARLRFQEAGMRAEAHHLLGDPTGASAAVREQEQVLADLQDRLGRVVSSAVLQRDAEQVLADVAATVRLDAAEPVVEAAPATDDRPRRPALAGVASVVAVLGVASAALLGVVRGVPPVEISEVAADAPTTEDGADTPAPTTGASTAVPARPLPGPPAPTGGTPATADTTTPDATPSQGMATPDGPTEQPAPEPTPAPELDEVVQELVDAVAGLGEPDPGPSDPETPSEDVDASISELDTLRNGIEQGLDPAEADTPTPTPTDGDDGFVPGGPGE